MSATLPVAADPIFSDKIQISMGQFIKMKNCNYYRWKIIKEEMVEDKNDESSNGGRGPAMVRTILLMHFRFKAARDAVQKCIFFIAKMIATRAWHYFLSRNLEGWIRTVDREMKRTNINEGIHLPPFISTKLTPYSNIILQFFYANWHSTQLVYSQFS